MDNDKKTITETLKARTIESLLTGLRYMTVPTYMAISVDGADAKTGLKEKQTIKFLEMVASKQPCFWTPKPRCSWPVGISSLRLETVDHI